MKIGYARVSTTQQKDDLQVDALYEAGCEEIFTDKISGVQTGRLGLESAIKALRAGDVLYAWRMDRLARSLSDLINIVKRIEDRGADFVSITEKIDTTTATGKLVFHLFGAMSEFERDLIVERTQAGLNAAKAKGVLLGRPKKLEGKDKSRALKMLETFSVSEVADHFGCHRSTLYRLKNTCSV
jgi:DNA invertase Pin-like site-specific DNA recombinase